MAIYDGGGAAPLLPDQESASRMTAPEAAPARQVESVTIRVAENGYTVSCTFKPTPSKDTQAVSPYEAPKDAVFQDVGEMLAYVQQKLGA